MIIPIIPVSVTELNITLLSEMREYNIYTIVNIYDKYGSLVSFGVISRFYLTRFSRCYVVYIQKNISQDILKKIFPNNLLNIADNKISFFDSKLLRISVLGNYTELETFIQLAKDNDNYLNMLDL